MNFALNFLMIMISAVNAGTCGLSNGSNFRSFVPELGRVCNVCRTLARQGTLKQNRSIRMKVACIGLVKHNCCAGLTMKKIPNVEFSNSIGYPRDFKSVSLGLLV